MFSKNCFIMLLLIGCSYLALAQNKTTQQNTNTFFMGNISKQYNIRLAVINVTKYIEYNDQNKCDSLGSVYITLKNKTIPLQKISLDSICINPNNLGFNQKLYKTSANSDASVIVGDFNFDGHDDLAVWTGGFASYGGPSYNVYLFDKKTNRLIYNKEFSDLSLNSIVMFNLDFKKRLIVSHNKVGCCFHSTDKFRVVNNHLILVEEINQELDTSRNLLKTTTKTLINGRWVYKIKEHHAE